MSETGIFHFDEIDWVDESLQGGSAPRRMRLEAERRGARRKQLARGESGYHSQYVTMPPGFEVPPHSHDHDELFIVLSGSCTLAVEDRRIELKSRDSAALAAGHEYGFTVGEEGIEFMVVRPGVAAVAFA